jgi:hypothetical protein
VSDRKYRQRGYLDEDRSRPAGGASPPVAPRSTEAPRGRGLGRPERQAFRCRDCGQEASLDVGPDTLCSRCGAALHACVNCLSFDPSARWECRADIATPVRSKTKANGCDRYQPKAVLELGQTEDRGKGDDPRAAFEALFR